MASVKVKFRPSSVNGKEGTIYYQIIQNRVIRQLKTDYRIFNCEWNNKEERISIENNKRCDLLLSLKERIDLDLKHLNSVINQLENRMTKYTADDVVSLFQQQTSEQSLFNFMQIVIARLQQLGKIRTAENYSCTLKSFMRFRDDKDVHLCEVNSDLIELYEAYLQKNGVIRNTSSFYMRILRAVYNRAVDRHLAPYVPHHFRYVYTGTRADRKRALDKEDMERLMKELPKQLCQDNKELQRTRGLFFLMFLLRGIPFVDLAYLKKHDIDGNVMTYRRRKTGRLLTVTLVPEAMKLIKRYMNTDPASPYLFSLITSGEGTEAAYKEYQLALRNFNYQLMILKQVLGLTSEVSSYTARHTWATMAYYCEVHPGVISEAMGHSSITVTETYLKPFKNKKIDEANVAVISSLKKVYSVGKLLN